VQGAGRRRCKTQTDGHHAILSISRVLYSVAIKSPLHARVADWLGLNRATLAVLAVIGFLGLSEEIWSNFLSLTSSGKCRVDPDIAFVEAALYMGVISSIKNLLEGFGYIIGGTVAHRMGPRVGAGGVGFR
jgi:hypothetical protein